MSIQLDYVIAALEPWRARSAEEHSPEQSQMRARYRGMAEPLVSDHGLGGFEERLTDALLEAASQFLWARALERPKKFGPKPQATKFAKLVTDIRKQLDDPGIRNRLVAADLARRIARERTEDDGQEAVYQPPIKAGMSGLTLLLSDLSNLAQQAASLDGRAANGEELTALRGALLPLIGFWRSVKVGSGRVKDWQRGDKQSPRVNFLAHALSIVVWVTGKETGDDADFDPESGAVTAGTVVWLLTGPSR